jgi:hypothetical protein
MIQEQEKKFNPFHQISNHSTEIEGQKRCLHMHKTRIGIPNARRNGSCEGIVVEMPTTLQITSLNIWWQRNALKNYIFLTSRSDQDHIQTAPHAIHKWKRHQKALVEISCITSQSTKIVEKIHAGKQRLEDAYRTAYMCFNLVKFPSVSGMDPLRLLSSSWSLFNLDRLPSSGGTDPVNWFPFTSLLTTQKNVKTYILGIFHLETKIHAMHLTMKHASTCDCKIATKQASGVGSLN